MGGLYFLIKTPNSSSQPQVGPSKIAAEPNTVAIKNFTFDPETLTVKSGTKVTWINQDTTVHTIKSTAFNSPDLGQGGKYEFVFDKTGSFDYSCGIHPTMRSKIVVE